jgi:ABC-type molybdate transport system substrate-binding protein
VSAITRRRFLSLAIAAGSLALASPLLRGPRQALLVAVGSELEVAMGRIEPLFEHRHPAIDLRWQVQGAQDMVNRQLDAGPERAKVLIPSNRDLLQAFAAARAAQGDNQPFQAQPRPIARTLLMAVAWPERATALFRGGRFSWSELLRATAAGQWSALGGPAQWGSIDLRITDPLRSNSGQLVLALWVRDQPGQAAVTALKRAVFRPARSTDILLREFISGGPNEGDVALVYESTALLRRDEAARRWPGGYRLLAPDPTIEMVLAAAVLRGEAQGSGSAAERFVTFLTSSEGQAVLRGAGFRGPAGEGGSREADGVRRLPSPGRAELEELLRQWQQSS